MGATTLMTKYDNEWDTVVPDPSLVSASPEPRSDLLCPMAYHHPAESYPSAHIGSLPSAVSLLPISSIKSHSSFWCERSKVKLSFPMQNNHFREFCVLTFPNPFFLIDALLSFGDRKYILSTSEDICSLHRPPLAQAVAEGYDPVKC